jgi:hypothetical protein
MKPKSIFNSICEIIHYILSLENKTLTIVLGIIVPFFVCHISGVSNREEERFKEREKRKIQEDWEIKALDKSNYVVVFGVLSIFGGILYGMIIYIFSFNQSSDYLSSSELYERNGVYFVAILSYIFYHSVFSLYSYYSFLKFRKKLKQAEEK